MGYCSESTGLPCFWQAGQHRMSKNQSTQIPRPARRRSRDAQHLGVWGVAPAGVQRAEPFGAPRGGVPAA